jgi:hypothetical protein
MATPGWLMKEAVKEDILWKVPSITLGLHKGLEIEFFTGHQ